MVWLDYAILAVIAVSTIIGLVRGFIREVLSLIVWVVAISCGLFFAKDVASLLEFIPGEQWRILLGFSSIFLAIVLLGSLLVYWIAFAAKAVGFITIDWILGILFGMIRGGGMVILFIMVANLTKLVDMPVWKDSIFIPYGQQSIDYLEQELQIHEVLEQWMAEFNHRES